MKYSKIQIKRFYENDMVATHANGDKVFNNILQTEILFKKLGDGEIIDNLPVLSPFTLKSFDKKEFWEWILCDVYSFTRLASYIQGWYISDKLKLLLENFKIAPQYYFYETQLLYKGEKLKYWIFQFPINPYQNIDFEKSKFMLPQDSNVYNFHSEDEYIFFYRKEHRETKRKLKGITNYLKDNYDIAKSTNNEIIVSERLKNAIEENGITGFEFSELDYEVVVQ
jgi:hypothetical protein